MPGQNRVLKQFALMEFPYEVRALKASDVAHVASLHALLFPDYFLAHLGHGFLRRFYYHFLDEQGIAFIALDGERYVGFVAGTPEPEHFYNEFYRIHFIPLTFITIFHFLADSLVRKEIYKRAGRIRAAINTVILKKRKAQASKPFSRAAIAKNEIPAHLLSIAVLADYRGKGIADELVRQFCARLYEEGKTKVMLTVQSQNEHAIQFYEKTGWRVVSKNGARVQFIRSTNPS
jgi:ribosomal protein S18 acetylase RimI-like enzyme